jgi:hypothetical protein
MEELAGKEETKVVHLVPEVIVYAINVAQKYRIKEA